jgi:hypothetical protein
MVKTWLAAGITIVLVSLAGCHSSPPASPSPENKVVQASTDGWLGRWDGPEGTFLQLSKTGDQYVVVVQDLDGAKRFAGFADGNRIRFERAGKTEYISAGDGEATGMKWLMDKKDCLLTKKGEGWCRG